MELQQQEQAFWKRFLVEVLQGTKVQFQSSMTLEK